MELVHGHKDQQSNRRLVWAWERRHFIAFDNQNEVIMRWFGLSSDELQRQGMDERETRTSRIHILGGSR